MRASVTLQKGINIIIGCKAGRQCIWYHPSVLSEIGEHWPVRVCSLGYIMEDVFIVINHFRGICYFFAEIQCAAKDLHSGVFGGTV